MLDPGVPCATLGAPPDHPVPVISCGYPSLKRPRLSRPVIAWIVFVTVLYAGTTVLVAWHNGPLVDVPMQLAVNLLHGQSSLGAPPGGFDTVTRDGQVFHVVGLGAILPYLLFAPLSPAWSAAPWIVSAAFGILAAALAWPLAEAYGPGGRVTPWLATLTAAGTLLLPLSDQGNFYYTAHVEATALVFVALLEWQGRRRGWLIAVAIGLAALARPTLLLAAIPFGWYLVATAERRAAAFLRFATPIAVAIGVMGLWNVARFGSPLDTGYGAAELHQAALVKARAAGVFSIRHLGGNLATLLAGGFDLVPTFPWISPSPSGHSILLTTPAVLVAINAEFRERTAQVLVVAAGLVLVPVLYYGGGGYRTFGYRYAMDAMPFILALVGLGARRHFGRIEQALIALSVAFCVFGTAWGIVNGHY